MLKPIAILGGTFDPIHLGHLYLAEAIKNHIDLKTIKIIPCYLPNNKIEPIASVQHRLAMLKLATADIPYLQIDDREIRRQGISYMADTLQELRQELGQEQSLCLIMGVDAFNGLAAWHRWNCITNLANLVIVNRPNAQISLQKEIAALLKNQQISSANDLYTSPAGKILFLDIKPLDISSTQIRKLIKDDKDVVKFLPTKVWEYIKQYKPYS
jgi:nicotinate-nucleotide adenylyltransferase